MYYFNHLCTTNCNKLHMITKCFLLNFLVCLSLFISPLQKQDTFITINPRNGQTTNKPQSVAYYSFRAHLVDGCMLVLESNISGEIAEVLLYSSVGDYYYGWFNTADKSLTIPISGQVGSYYLTIRKSSGEEYTAEFNI